MPKDEWFRRTSWSHADEEAFWARLARSRGVSNKAQYLRIQAHTLAETHEDALVRVALRLLERLLADFPEPFQLAASYQQAAQCHEHFGELEQAIRYFRLALDAVRRHRGLDAGTALEFPWFIIEHRLIDLYDEAIITLGSVQDAHLVWPVAVFKMAAIRAMVANARGDHQSAAARAREALDAAHLEKSPFRYHRELGLVGEKYRRMIDLLTRMAAA